MEGNYFKKNLIFSKIVINYTKNLHCNKQCNKILRYFYKKSHWKKEQNSLKKIVLIKQYKKVQNLFCLKINFYLIIYFIKTK